MAEFSVRSDSVNVEQIMEQIRSRIREKRGVDYTEEQIRELAAVKLQKFLDPRGVRSDLLEQFRKTQPPYTPPQLPNYAFEDNTLFDSHRGGLRFIRKLLNPILKLFFNPNPLIQALNIQSRVNTMLAEREARLEASRRSTESLYYELIHNLVVETTRLGIEMKNLSMRIESMSSRLEFNERRARALEGAVVYKPGPGDIVVTGRQGSQGSQGSQGFARFTRFAGFTKFRVQKVRKVRRVHEVHRVQKVCKVPPPRKALVVRPVRDQASGAVDVGAVGDDVAVDPRR